MPRFNLRGIESAAVVLCIVLGAPAWSQAPIQRVPAYLPHSHGATALSAQIHAEAAFMQGYGDMLESASVARYNNALSTSIEIDNARKWVETYFDIRQINRERRALEDPNYLMQEEKAQEVFRKRIAEQYQDIAQGDVTKELNWLLRELASLSLAYQYLPGGQELAGVEGDQGITPEDVFHIRFTDGVSGGGSQLTFRADEAQLLETRWPQALRAPEFDESRRRFEQARDAVLAEARAKKDIAYETGEALRQAVDGLAATLVTAYPESRRFESGEMYERYRSAKRYIQSLAANSARIIETNDPGVFDGSRKFAGTSIVELVSHMYGKSLEFATPERGDEAVYRKLFLGMRALYMHLSADGSVVGDAGT